MEERGDLGAIDRIEWDTVELGNWESSSADDGVATGLRNSRRGIPGWRDRGDK